MEEASFCGAFSGGRRAAHILLFPLPVKYYETYGCE